ncbi:MAG: phosphate signaling complex protein PhoU [bacterium]|nr:phosphate signaling complex protein PhoU [bacterium]
MTKHMLRALNLLKDRVEELGRTVQRATADAVRSVIEGDQALAKRIIEGDRRIDQEEVEVEEECLKVLALHQPVATDLRLLVGILKLNNDLERIGDLAVTIAGNAGKIDLSGDARLADILQRLSGRSQDMLQLGLDSLVHQDQELARRVCADDDDVDNLYSLFRSAIQETLAAETGHNDLTRIESLMRAISVSRSLERIADHATNIAEDVIYMVSGEIPRHGALRDLRLWKDATHSPPDGSAG